MKWYWPISCDDAQPNPFVAFEGSLAPFEEWHLRSCKPTENRTATAWVGVGLKGNDGDPDDVLQTLFGLPIYSSRLCSVLGARQIEGIQYLPIRVYRRDGSQISGFNIANVLNCVEALDLDRSSYRRYADSYFLESRRGQIQILQKAVLRRDALSGFDIIRLREFHNFLAVSQRLVEAFEDGRFTGYSFSELEVSPARSAQTFELR